MTGGDSVHQGIALQVPPYSYKDPNELLDRALSQSSALPLLVALDGITDPRNLGCDNPIGCRVWRQRNHLAAAQKRRRDCSGLED